MGQKPVRWSKPGKLDGQVDREMSQLDGSFPQQGDTSQAKVARLMGYEYREVLEICNCKGCAPEELSSSLGIQPTNLHWRWESKLYIVIIGQVFSRFDSCIRLIWLSSSILDSAMGLLESLHCSDLLI